MEMIEKKLLEQYPASQTTIEEIKEVIQKLYKALNEETDEQEKRKIKERIKRLNLLRKQICEVFTGSCPSDGLDANLYDEKISQSEKKEKFNYFLNSSDTMCLSGYSEDIAGYKKELLEKMEDYNFHIIHISPSDVYNPERKEHFADDFWNKIKKETDKIRKRFGQKGYKKQSLYESLAFNTIEDEEGFGHYILIDFDKVEELFTLDISEEERKKLFYRYELLLGLRPTSYEEFLYWMPDGKKLKFIPSLTRWEQQRGEVPNRMIFSISKDHLHDFLKYGEWIPDLRNYYAC